MNKSGIKNSNNLEERNLSSSDEIWRMFDKIAQRYDLLNHILSIGMDYVWRNEVASHLISHQEQVILDLATGTSDLIISICNKNSNVKFAVGLDMAPRMLYIGQKKIEKRKLNRIINLTQGDINHIPFADNTFDAVTIAFGIRNVKDVQKSLVEIYRVLKPGGKAVILEFSLPENKPVKVLYLFYFRSILPRIGTLISGNGYAYRYLNQSVETFPYGRKFCDLLTAAGFRSVLSNTKTFGIATIYRCVKP